MIYALLTLAVTNVSTLIALAYSFKLASTERRILFAASLEADRKTDAARRAMSPTHAEAKASVDQQLKLMKEAQENGGVFQAPPGSPAPKPVGI